MDWIKIYAVGSMDNELKFHVKFRILSKLISHLDLLYTDLSMAYNDWLSL